MGAGLCPAHAVAKPRLSESDPNLRDCYHRKTTSRWSIEGRMYLDRKYSYRRTLPHLIKDNRPVFVTFTTYKRWRIPEPARDLVVNCCLQEHGVTIDLHTLVVMPDHVHLLFTPLRDAEGLLSLPQILRLVKGRSAHLLNKSLRPTSHKR